MLKTFLFSSVLENVNSLIITIQRKKTAFYRMLFHLQLKENQRFIILH
jgi:hypothetical protein